LELSAGASWTSVKITAMITKNQTAAIHCWHHAINFALS